MQLTQILAQITDGIIEYANRRRQPASQRRFQLDQILGRFNQQAGCIHFLDGAVVQFTRNPLALVSQHLLLLH